MKSTFVWGLDRYYNSACRKVLTQNLFINKAQSKVEQIFIDDMMTLYLISTIFTLVSIAKNPVSRIFHISLIVFIAIFSNGQDSELYWEAIPETDSIHATIAVDSKTFFSEFPQPKLYFDGSWRDAPRFTDLYRLSSGALVGATYGHVLKSADQGITWDTLDPGIFVSDGMKKGRHNSLYVLRYDGIWISEDEGISWAHSCPPAYFPGFSVNARTITIARPSLYYGRSQNGDILSFDGAVRTEYASIQDGNRVTLGYAVDHSKKLYVMEKTIATQDISLYADSPGDPTHKIDLPAPSTSSELDMYYSDVLLHTSNQVFLYSDFADSWFDLTLNLDSTSIIANVSVSPIGNTIYLTLQNGVVHRSAYRPVSTTIPSQKILSIYPNPTSEYIFLQGDLSYDAHIQILDLHGNIVKNLTKYTAMIDVSDLTPGRYLLSTSSTDLSFPFIKI